MNTKQKIINEALTLFSINGYDAISVRDIAAAVGIKASSLYNHFKNKQDIFDTIIEICTERSMKFFQHIKDCKELKEMINNSKRMSDLQFTKISLDMFKFYLEDEYIVKFRKMLTIEQFHNYKISNLYHKIFIDDILDFQCELFNILINANVLIKKDPYTLALQFYSPVFLLFYKHDKFTDKERISLKNHIFQFKDTYIMKG